MTDKIPMYSEWRRKDGTGSPIKVTGLTKSRVLFHPTKAQVVRMMSLPRAKFLEIYELK